MKDEELGRDSRMGSPFDAMSASYVDAYKRGELQSVDARAALELFRQRIADAPVEAASEGEDAKPTRHRAALWWIGGAAVAAVAAGLLLWRPTLLRTEASGPGGSLAPDAMHGDSEGEMPALRERAAASRARERHAKPVDARELTVDAEPLPAPVETLEPGSSPDSAEAALSGGAPVQPRLRSKPRVRNDAAATPASSPISPQLERELRLIAGIRGAARSGAHARALKLVDLHARTFPSGALAPERDLIALESLCALERYDDLKRAQSKYAKTHRGHHLARKAAATCDNHD